MVGVSTIVIGHVKTKDVADVVTGETYQILTSDQQQNYFNAIKKNLHFLGLAYIDRTIAKEKTGKKNIVTKKDEVVGKIKDETRKIKFRDDSYAVDSGSRFADIVSEINLDADEYIEALTNAILAEQKKSGVSLDKVKKEQAKERKAEEKRIAEAEKAKKSEKATGEVVSEILEYLKANKSDMDIVKPIMTATRELGYENPSKIDNMKDAKAILELCK